MSVDWELKFTDPASVNRIVAGYVDDLCICNSNAAVDKVIN